MQPRYFLARLAFATTWRTSRGSCIVIQTPSIRGATISPTTKKRKLSEVITWDYLIGHKLNIEHNGQRSVYLTVQGCKLAQRVAFLRTTVKATVVTCRVRNPACTTTKRPWEPALYKWSKRPWRSRRYINKFTYLLTNTDYDICMCRSRWFPTDDLLLHVETLLGKAKQAGGSDGRSLFWE